MSARYIVMLHGFVNLPEGGQEHCCNGMPDGWHVWLRDNEPKNGEPFDTIDSIERDFDQKALARGYAANLAKNYACEIDEY